MSFAVQIYAFRIALNLFGVGPSGFEQDNLFEFFICISFQTVPQSEIFIVTNFLLFGSQYSEFQAKQIHKL